MRLGSLTIENFRGIDYAEIPLHSKLTLLVGANNAGKTTVLDALAAILNYRRGLIPFSDLDFNSQDAQADPRAAKPIKIQVTVVPTDGKKFKPGELGSSLFPETLDDGNERLRLRLITRFDDSIPTQPLRTHLVRLEENQEPDENTDLGSFPLRELMPLRAFGMERDLGRGTAARFSPWGQMLAEIYPKLEVLKPAMEKLREGSNHLIQNTAELTALSNGLHQLARLVGVSQTALSVAPEDLEMLMRQLFVVLTQQGSSRGFSGGRHGQGTQSVLLFGIYKVFTAALVERYGGDSELNPVLTVEEPETHLHPIARRAMARQLHDLPGQIIITTHSDEIVAEVTPDQVILLRSNGGRCTIGSFPAPDPKGVRKLRQQAHALFARSLILVEGEEGEMLPMLAVALGYDLSALGIEWIDARGQDGIPGLYRLFHDAYGLPTVCVADADEKEKIENFLTAIDPSLLQEPEKPSDLPALVEAARTRDYHCCPAGKNIEETLADEVPDLVDKFLAEAGEPDYQTWRANLQHPDHVLKKQRKKLSELSEAEARAYRLRKYKTQYPRALGGWLVSSPARIPAHLRQAILRAVTLAGGV